MHLVHTLRLTGGKYYLASIGNTPTLDNTSKWVKLYPPFSNLSYRGEVCDRGRTLDDCVIEAMRKYGINNVRGGSYSSVALSVPQIIRLRKLLGKHVAKQYHIVVNTRRTPPRCNMCGGKTRKGECPICINYTCSRCKKKGHWLMQCPSAHQGMKVA